MLLSGPRSYFNDYARKNGLGRALNDPPTLLTDRGAYVNFLEVQLERVCATCLSVQSYDSKFNDMHEMIVGLEKRCGNTTKLVNIAQQCTLELRNENEAKLQTVTNNVKGEHYEMQKLLEAMSVRISAAEQVLTTLPSLVARMDTIESRIAKNEIDFELYQKNMAEKSKADDEEFLQLKNARSAFKEDIEKIRSDVSKNTFDIQENDSRTRRVFTTMEETFQEELKTDRGEVSRKLEVVTSNTNFQLEKLQADSVSRESGCHSALRLFKEANTEHLELMNKDILQRCESIETEAESRFSTLNSSMEEAFAVVDKKIVMTGNRVSVLSTDFEDHKRVVAGTLDDFDADMDDIYDSIDEVSSKISAVADTAEQALATGNDLTKDVSDINDDIKLLDRILGETDDKLNTRFHELNRLFLEVSNTGLGHSHNPQGYEDGNMAISSPSESEDDRKPALNSSRPHLNKLHIERPSENQTRLDSDGNPILDYIGAGLYSGVGPRKAAAGKAHIRKMVTIPSPDRPSSRTVSFDPVMRPGSPPAKKDKLGYIGSGIYWDRSQPFDKHLVLEILEDMKDSDSVDPIERAELLYSANHAAKSPPDHVRARIRALQRDANERDQNDGYVSRLARPDSKSSASLKSDVSNAASNGDRRPSIGSDSGKPSIRSEGGKPPIVTESRQRRRSSVSAVSEKMSLSSAPAPASNMRGETASTGSMSTKQNLENAADRRPSVGSEGRKPSSEAPETRRRRRSSMSAMSEKKSVSTAPISSNEAHGEAATKRSVPSVQEPPRRPSEQQRRASMGDATRGSVTSNRSNDPPAATGTAANKNNSTGSTASTLLGEKIQGSEVKKGGKPGNFQLFDAVSSQSIATFDDDDDQQPQHADDHVNRKGNGNTARVQSRKDQNHTNSKRYDNAGDSSHHTLDDLVSSQREPFSGTSEFSSVTKSIADGEGAIRNSKIRAVSHAINQESVTSTSRNGHRLSDDHEGGLSSELASTVSYSTSSSNVTLESIQDRVKSALRNQDMYDIASDILDADNDGLSESQKSDVYEQHDLGDDEGGVYQIYSDEESGSSEDIDDDMSESRSLTDLSEEIASFKPLKQRRSASQGRSVKARKQRGATSKIVPARRSVSPHLTIKPEYFYYNDILAAEVKAARTSPHDRVPEKPWVPNSSTTALRKVGFPPSVDDSAVGMRRAREARVIAQSCEVSRSTEALVDVPLFTTPSFRSVNDSYKGRRHFDTRPAVGQAKGAGVLL